MALIHDIAESVIGDLTPDQAKNVNKHDIETVCQNKFLFFFYNIIVLTFLFNKISL